MKLAQTFAIQWGPQSLIHSYPKKNLVDFGAIPFSIYCIPKEVCGIPCGTPLLHFPADRVTCLVAHTNNGGAMARWNCKHHLGAHFFLWSFFKQLPQTEYGTRLGTQVL